MRPNHVVGRSSPPYRVLVPVRPSGSGLHRADQIPLADAPVAGARLALSIGVFVAIPLLALNLRPAVTSVGALLTDIQSGTGMSAVLASAVVAAPVWCFAVGGALAWTMRTRLGTSRTVSLALATLALALAARVMAGPYLLLSGTIVACLAIAVLGTLLPVITHAAPTRAWALLTGCYVAAMGGGSGIGALVTPQVAGGSSWQLGVSGWALLAAAAWAAWRVASRRFAEAAVRTRKHPGPGSLAPAGTAWSLTLHFGLTSGFTFSIMGWLPSILLEYVHVEPVRVEWMFTLAMALGVPIALLVPKWARATAGQSGLAVALAAPSLVATVGLLMFPAWSPWLWAVGLGLGMPAVGLALAMISLRAAPDGDTAAALSSMVQGVGYAIAGASALACGLLHSATGTWEWPMLALLVILCGQIVSGMHAGVPITVYAGDPPPEARFIPAARVPAQLPPAARRVPMVTTPAPPDGWRVALKVPPPPIPGRHVTPVRGRFGPPRVAQPMPVPVAAQVHGPFAPPVHGPFIPPVHGPFIPPVHGPLAPPVPGPAGRPGPVRRRPAIAGRSVTESLIPRRRAARASDTPVTESLRPARRDDESPVTEAVVPAPRPKRSCVADDASPVAGANLAGSWSGGPVDEAPVTEALVPSRSGRSPVAEDEAPVTEAIVPAPRSGGPADGDSPVTEAIVPAPRSGGPVDGDSPVTEALVPGSRSGAPVDEAPVTEALFPAPRPAEPPPTPADDESPVTEVVVPRTPAGATAADPAVTSSQDSAGEQYRAAEPVIEVPEPRLAEQHVAHPEPSPATSGADGVPEPWGAEPSSPGADEPLARAEQAREEPVADKDIEPVADAVVPEPRDGAVPTGNGSTGNGSTGNDTAGNADSRAAATENGAAEGWASWVPDSLEPVQLEFALMIEQPAPAPVPYEDRTIHIPYPRRPSS